MFRFRVKLGKQLSTWAQLVLTEKGAFHISVDLHITNFPIKISITSLVQKMFLPFYCILASLSQNFANMGWRQGNSLLSDTRQVFIPISHCTACSNCITLVSRAYTGRCHEILLAHKVIWMTVIKLAMKDTLKTPSWAWVSSLILKENYWI